MGDQLTEQRANQQAEQQVEQQANQTITVLAICAHPDDAELHCGGLLLSAKQNGATIGVVDLTRGEAASRGTPQIRAQEAAKASQLLGLTIRDNLGLPDAMLTVNDHATQLVVEKIRQYTPKLVVTSHWDDHHPDHQVTANLVKKACYLAGIGNFLPQGNCRPQGNCHPQENSQPQGNYHTQGNDQPQYKPHRPEQVMYYLDRLDHKPDIVQDVSDVFEQKLQAVHCYASQLYDSNSNEMSTPLASVDFIEQWRARHLYYGSLIGVKYGEGYVLRSPVALNNPLNLLWGRKGQV